MLRVCLCSRRTCVSLNSWFLWYCLSKCKCVIVRPGNKITRLSYCSCALRRHVHPKLCIVFWSLTFVHAITHQIRNDNRLLSRDHILMCYTEWVPCWKRVGISIAMSSGNAILKTTFAWDRRSGMTVAAVPENQKTKKSWDTLSALRWRLGNSKREWIGNLEQQYLRFAFSLVPRAKTVTVCLALRLKPNIAKSVSKRTRRMHMSMLSPSRKDDTVCKWKAFLCDMCSMASASTNHLEQKRNSEMKSTLRSRILKVFQHEY